MTTFEIRHRKLRESAGGFPYADEAAATAAEEAEDRLRDFHGRTDPLVDDLVSAVREERRLSHRMDAYSSRDLRGNPPTITTLGMEHDAAVEAVEEALAALDEGARG